MSRETFIMTSVTNSSDAALAPAAAAARQVDAGVEATRKALDQLELEGRLAVRLIRETAKAVEPAPVSGERGALVDRTA
jgi:hypothetical protein